MYMYIYTHTYTYIHIYIHVYICIHRLDSVFTHVWLTSGVVLFVYMCGGGRQLFDASHDMEVDCHGLKLKWWQSNREAVDDP